MTWSAMASVPVPSDYARSAQLYAFAVLSGVYTTCDRSRAVVRAAGHWCASVPPVLGGKVKCIKMECRNDSPDHWEQINIQVGNIITTVLAGHDL
ncbi:hypothetical protein E2C01_022218 [Portunus trituberculatus]|uniref:Uncharacterized protein n=1 Tax=Portunus trituberculatus TaxID=210409 RepID=A0A5B7E4S9_PORTR|nr:hypothetical protein [Portunus trituberculatus]